MPITRRRFLTYLGMGTYSLLCQGPRAAGQVVFPLPRRKRKAPDFFKPIAPSTEDRLILPKGYRSDLICAWNDPLGSKGPHGPELFGFDSDLIVYFPIDALNGGSSNADGLLWVNHENASPVFVSRHNRTDPITEAQIIAEKLAMGGSVIHVRRDNGSWKLVPDSKYNRRLTALYPKIAMTGPAAELVPHGTGTLANCSGGRTPWFTVLSCEENFQDFNGTEGDGEYKGHRWADVPAQKIDEREYGWVVEIDPFGELPPVKHTALGRFCHENTAWRLGRTGRLVIYLGDDAADQYLYKFISADKYDPKAPRADQRKLLTQGTLYVAEFGKGNWLPLDLKLNPDLAGSFKSQGELLLSCREAAKRAGGTPLDRPEDCEVHPGDGTLYLALSNNKKHGNFHGQIVRLIEDKDNAEGSAFRFEIFLAGGPQTGLSSPDNLCFDKRGNLWVACDMSSSALNKGVYEGLGNNGMFVVPTSGPSTGEAFQFASGPCESELTGPWFTENEDTLFLAVQHPGCTSKSADKSTSHWPEGGAAIPRPAVVAITGFK